MTERAEYGCVVKQHVSGEPFLVFELLRGNAPGDQRQAGVARPEAGDRLRRGGGAGERTEHEHARACHNG
jgi:hypothetical protein